MPRGFIHRASAYAARAGDAYVRRPESAGYDWDTAALAGAAGSWHDHDISAVVPAGAVACLMLLEIINTDAANAQAMSLRGKGVAQTEHAVASRKGSTDIALGIVSVPASRLIQYNYQAGITTRLLYVMGWWI